MQFIFQNNNHTFVSDFWLSNPSSSLYTWKYLHRWSMQIDMEYFHPILEELKNHKIKQATRKYILMWGHEPKGTFITKESYHLLVHAEDNPQDSNWNKIWSLKIWSKIHNFLWLLRHKRTLTWENIMKRGFTVPSQCVMCYK